MDNKIDNNEFQAAQFLFAASILLKETDKEISDNLLNVAEKIINKIENRLVKIDLDEINQIKKVIKEGTKND